MTAPTPLPVAAAPQADCPVCSGDGVVMGTRGLLAHAQLCTCVPPCSRCRGTGQVTLEQDGHVLVGRCVCRRTPDRIALFNRSGVPGRFHHATMHSFSTGILAHGAHDKMPALMDVSTWLGDYDPAAENQGLVLHGAVGRGKTHLLIGLVRRLIFEKGVPSRFMEFSRLLGLLKESYDAGRGSSELMDELARVPVLAIDELGKGRLTDWELSVIDEIISRRYNAMRCTLATTNYAPRDPSGAAPANLARSGGLRQTLGDRVGERVWSRLRQMCLFVEVSGRDFRAPRRS